MKSNFTGAVLLGGKTESQALTLFKRNFAPPWETLRFRVQYRLPEDDESLPKDPRRLYIIVTDPFTRLITMSAVPIERIETAANDPKQLSVVLQQASDAVRQSMGKASKEAVFGARCFARLKERRDKRRKANA